MRSKLHMALQHQTYVPKTDTKAKATKADPGHHVKTLVRQPTTVTEAMNKLTALDQTTEYAAGLRRST